MSKTGLGVALGLCTGVLAVVAYRRSQRPRSLSSAPVTGELPDAATGDVTPVAPMPIVRGGSTAMATTSPQSVIAKIDAYLASARAQLDTALAEGKAVREQTRTELEARFTAAKQDPASAKKAFD